MGTILSTSACSAEPVTSTPQMGPTSTVPGVTSEDVPEGQTYGWWGDELDILRAQVGGGRERKG